MRSTDESYTQAPPRSFGVIVAATVLAAIAVQVSGLREGWSIPAFGRKYQLSCRDCHIGASAKLNEFGQQFQDQGYQLPQNHGRMAEASRAEPESSEVIFTRHCEACHGTHGAGDGPMGQVLVPPAADLTSRRTQAKSDDELLRIIREGISSTSMPAFKSRLTEREVRGVLAYLRSFSRDPTGRR
jgi:mono/diheme cytochrome c family protein